MCEHVTRPRGKTVALAARSPDIKRTIRRRKVDDSTRASKKLLRAAADVVLSDRSVSVKRTPMSDEPESDLAPKAWPAEIHGLFMQD